MLTHSRAESAVQNPTGVIAQTSKADFCLPHRAAQVQWAQTPAERIVDNSLFLLVILVDDKSLPFSVHRDV